MSRFHGSVVGQARASGSYKHEYSTVEAVMYPTPNIILPILEAGLISHIKIVEKCEMDVI